MAPISSHLNTSVQVVYQDSYFQMRELGKLLLNLMEQFLFENLLCLMGLKVD
jgi:hypothetical protein